MGPPTLGPTAARAAARSPAGISSERVAPSAPRKQDRPRQRPADQAAPAAGVAPAPRLWRGYLSSLEQRPLLTKSATCFGCTVAADALAQALGGQQGFDAARSLQLAAYAGTVGAATVHVWHRWLDGTVRPECPTSARAVVEKVAMDQLLFTPVSTLAFFAFLKLMDGQGLEAVLPFARDKLPGTLLASYAIWPAVNMVLFAFVPTDLRILFGNLVGLAWGAYLSLTCIGAGGAPAADLGAVPPAEQGSGFVMEMAQPVPAAPPDGGAVLCDAPSPGAVDGDC